MRMRVIVPHVEITPECDNALWAYAPTAERIDVGHDDEAYWRLLNRLWHTGQSFLLIEHDVVIGPDTVAEMTGCPKEWCAASYPYISTVSYGLACTKFRGSLMARFPNLFDMIGEAEIMRHPKRHWCTLDMGVSPILWALGVSRCQFHNGVGHPGHDFSSTHGCALAPAAG